MQKALKKFFMDDKIFTIAIVAVVIGAVADIARMAVIGMLSSAYVVGRLLFLFSAICTYVSFKKHNKNVMKGMLGATVTYNLMNSLYATAFLQYPHEKILSPIDLTLCSIIFIVHFIINSDRHSRPVYVFVNQIASILLVIEYTMWMCGYIPHYQSAVATVSLIITSIAFAGFMYLIVSVESRLDAYRLDREAAGWTEEAGYPEGYVHEYEKK